MNIRKARKEDVKEVIKLTKIPEFDNPNLSNNLNSSKYFQEYVKRGIFLVAEINDEIIGFITGEFMLGNYVYIDALAVNPLFRDKGIGKKLVKEFEDVAKKKGAKYVHLTAPKNNNKTINFYEKNKYEKGEQYIQFYKKL